MNTTYTSKLKAVRKSYHLKLKDLSHILNINSSNLSRFEAGQTHAKALVGYHILFNVPMASSIRQLFKEGYEELIHRCFQLLERIDATAQSVKDEMRKQSINHILEHLTKLQEQYEG